jgi:hypothetical protein
MMSRSEVGEIPLRKPEQTNRRSQAPAMLRMQRVFELFLEMNERPSGLNQPFEIVCIGRFGLEPKLLEHVMRFVVTFFIPALEKRAIERMLCNVSRVWIDIFEHNSGHELRNPLAFVHEGFNLLLVLCNRYGLPIAARSLGEFQEASEALPRKHSGLAKRATPKFAQRTAARRVELKMARRLRCASVTGRKGHAPLSRLGGVPF